MEIAIFMVVMWYGGLFFQTFFLHRYSAHQMFTMSKFTEKVFFVLTWIFQGSNYLSAYGYGIMHRMHHAYADTPQDPHSPKYDETIFKMMWKTKTIYSGITSKSIKVDSRFTDGIPEWVAFDSFARSWVSRLGWGTAYVLFFYQFATAPWQYALLPVAWMMAPIHGVVINWFAHKYGYTNFKVGDTSKNLLPVDVLMMGESYHNNHHKHSDRANFGGFRWHELDPTYMVIILLDKLNIIQLKKEMALNTETIKKAA